MKCLIFASCDGDYYRQFGVSFCKSAVLNGHRVHVHIVNSNGVADTLEHPLISYSFEEGAPQAREYYASSRFYLAPKLLKQLPEGVDGLLILDVDSIIRLPFDLPDQDVGLFWREVNNRQGEWVERGSRVAAGAVCYGKGGQAFAERVAEQLRSLPQEWLVDQVALAETADEFDGQVGIFNLADQQGFFDLHLFAETSAIWSGKGRRKFDREAYIEEMERWRNLPLA